MFIVIFVITSFFILGSISPLLVTEEMKDIVYIKQP